MLPGSIPLVYFCPKDVEGLNIANTFHPELVAWQNGPHRGDGGCPRGTTRMCAATHHGIPIRPGMTFKKEG